MNYYSSTTKLITAERYRYRKIEITHNERTGIAAGVELKFLPPVTAARLCTKDKYLEQMFGDVGQARTKARICRTVDCCNVKPQLQKTFVCT